MHRRNGIYNTLQKPIFTRRGISDGGSFPDFFLPYFLFYFPLNTVTFGFIIVVIIFLRFQRSRKQDQWWHISQRIWFKFVFCLLWYLIFIWVAGTWLKAMSTGWLFCSRNGCQGDTSPFGYILDCHSVLNISNVFKICGISAINPQIRWDFYKQKMLKNVN